VGAGAAGVGAAGVGAAGVGAPGVGAAGVATIGIGDDDVAELEVFASLDAAEPVTNGEFLVTLSKAVAGPVLVEYTVYLIVVT